MPVHQKLRSRARFPLAVLACAALLTATAGLSCDDNADADFRQSATQAIGSGIKTIANGLIDGWVNAILNAGDGDTTSAR